MLFWFSSQSLGDCPDALRDFRVNLRIRGNTLRNIRLGQQKGNVWQRIQHTKPKEFPFFSEIVSSPRLCPLLGHLRRSLEFFRGQLLSRCSRADRRLVSHRPRGIWDAFLLRTIQQVPILHLPRLDLREDLKRAVLRIRAAYQVLSDAFFLIMCSRNLPSVMHKARLENQKVVELRYPILRNWKHSFLS